MPKTLRLLLLTLAVAGLTTANVRVASANWLGGADAAPHNWWQWHFDGSTITAYVFGSHQTQAKRAINDWNNLTQIRIPSADPTTAGMLVYGANFGDTGWGGLASITGFTWDFHCWGYCRVTKGVARFNSFYGGSSTWWAQGVFCQEVGHLFGLAHNSSGGCMGLSYFPNQGNRPSSHDISDVNAKY